MSFVTGVISERLGGGDFGQATETYKFTKIKKAKTLALAAHPNVRLFDFGIGEPDLPADPSIVRVLAEEAGKPENRRYADNGIVEFQQAAAAYLRSVYHVSGLNPLENILHGIGSKPILAMLPLGFISPGDVTLATTPGYPVISTYTRYLGGKVYDLPLRKENDFYPDFGDIPQHVLKRAKLLYVNYPNNPTGQVATIEFFEQVVEFAQRNRIVVVCDAAYAALTYDGHQSQSFLSVDGADQVGVEVHSLSKAFNMTGWRLGFIAGNKQVVEVYGTVKDNSDSGQFRAIQKAGIYALNHPELTRGYCERYSRRFDSLVQVLRRVGFDAHKPKASFYCYVPIPQGTRSGIRFQCAEEVSEFLITRALVSTVPWDDAGSFLRFSVTFEAGTPQAEKELLEELEDRLLRLELVF